MIKVLVCSINYQLDVELFCCQERDKQLIEQHLKRATNWLKFDGTSFFNELKW